MQLALQGGGAKIVSLVAVLEAVEKLESEGVIQITRIAGTSAGAIAGALYAARVPMIQVKEKLAAFRTEIAKFPKPGKVRAAWSMLWGNPIASTAAIAKALGDLLKQDPIRVNVVGDLKIKTMIMSADLFTGTTHVAQDQEHVVNALLDSSALPIYFRNWNSNRGGVVDGGICENLPLPPEDKTGALGPVVGVSFPKPRTETVQGAGAFLKSLLDTAIQNSVERARNELGPDSVMRVFTAIDTFDFEKALDDEKGLGAEYTNTRKDADDWLRKYVKTKMDVSVAPADPNLWESQNVESMRRLGSVYVTQHERSKYHLKHAIFSVTAHSLLQNHEPLQGRDLVCYQLVFETLDDPIYCQWLALTVAEDSKSHGMATVRISGPNPGALITPTLLPVIKPREAQRLAETPVNPEKVNVRELVVFFDPVLPVRSGPYTLTLEDWVDNAMSPLQKIGEDNLFIQGHVRASRTVDRTDLVLNVPKSFGPVDAFALSPPPNQAAPMSDDILDEYKGPGGLFNTIGWTCRGCNPLKPLAIGLKRKAS